LKNIEFCSINFIDPAFFPSHVKWHLEGREEGKISRVFSLFARRIFSKEKKMKKLFIFFLLMAFVFAGAEDLLKKGDELVAKRETVDMIKKAISLYKQALKEGADKYEVYWRILRATYTFKHKKMKKKERIKLYEEAIKLGEEAIKLKPDRPEAHFWLGVLYGVYGEDRGVLKSLFLIKPIKREMQKVLQIDPTYDCGGVYRVLGRLYYKVPGFAGGSKKKSLEYLLKGKEICPQSLLGRIYLAETLIKLKRKSEAKKELEEALKMEAPPDEKPEEKEYKERIKKLLSKL
jgi:tetratricopeptide (TPR) repeat protein